MRKVNIAMRNVKYLDHAKVIAPLFNTWIADDLIIGTILGLRAWISSDFLLCKPRFFSLLTISIFRIALSLFAFTFSQSIRDGLDCRAHSSSNFVHY